MQIFSLDKALRWNLPQAAIPVAFVGSMPIHTSLQRSQWGFTARADDCRMGLEPDFNGDPMRASTMTAQAPRTSASLVMRLMAATVLVVAAGGTAVNARAQGMDGPGGPGHGRGMMMFGGPPEHMGRAIDHMLDGLVATDAQRSQIKQIALAAATDLKAQRESERALRDKGMQLFAAPTVDATAAESLRQQMSAQHDQASKRMLQAMLDVSKVLTPEQRAKLAQRMSERRAIMQERMQRDQREHGQRQQK